MIYLKPLREGFIGPPTKPWYLNREPWHFSCHFPDGSVRAIRFKCTYPNGSHRSHKWVPKEQDGFVFNENGVGEWFAFPEEHKKELENDPWSFTKLLVRYFP